MELKQKLGWAGVIPFAVLPFAFLVGLEMAMQAFVSYSAVIFSFLCGALWGQCVGKEEVSRRLLMSNLLALLAWLCLLLNAPAVSLWLLMLGYFTLLMLETGLEQDACYRRLRVQLSTCVIVFHLLMLSIR